MSFIVPIPPNPDENQYKSSPLAYSRAIYDWSLKTKGKLEQSKPLANGVAITTPVAGDIAYYANNLGWTRLAGGTAGQVLTYGTGTAPAWGNIVSNLAAGAAISITGTATQTIQANIAAGANISVTGTATATIALAANVTNSFPARTPIAGTSYSILTSDYLVAYTTLGSAVTVTLPTNAVTNQKFILKDEAGNSGTNNLTLATGTSAQKIDGASTKVINSNYGILRTYFSGANYFTW